MTTLEKFAAYCKRWELTVMLKPDLDEAFGDEEFPSEEAAGFVGDPVYCACVAVLKSDGTMEVVKAFAGDPRDDFTEAMLMEDVWEAVTDEELASGAPLHATE